MLRPVPDASAFRTVLQYTPEEVRERYLQKRRQDLGTWVETFAPFWGLLKGEDQKQLEKLYGFIPMKYTAYTVAAIGVVSGINVVVSILNITSGIGGPWDALWLLGAGYFFLESVIRFKDWMKNKPSGSALGGLLRPFAKSILRGY